MRILTMIVMSLVLSTGGQAFCGFYVAKADATIFNSRSQVIMVRDGNRNVVTMSNDFKGDVRDFAMVIPVPTILQRDDIRVVNPALFSMLDSYSAPRMVEYWDENPCQPRYMYEENESMSLDMVAPTSTKSMRSLADKKYGVKVEARYDVEEYDVLILSAKESNGLKQWLIENGYKIPHQAEEVLDPYIKNGMKFFVVKVDLEEMNKGTSEYLRPIQISFNADRFMLPLRLGMANADGDQDMIVYAFTKQGRVECTNYRTVKLPTDRNIPSFVKDKGQFGEFYKDLFAKAHEREGRNSVFLEYAWNVTPNFGIKCDPCVGPPPMYQEFVDAGASWVDPNDPYNSSIFFTRLHVRYSRDEFPQDLFFQVTPNTEQFQGRYIVTNPASGDLSCGAGQEYLQGLEMRRKREVDELAVLTGWKNPRYAKYIYEYSDQIHEPERNEATPFIPWSKGGPAAGILLLIASGALVISHKKRRLVPGRG